jgi:hypothetical protein
VCEREASAWFDGDADKVDALAAQVAAWTSLDLAPETVRDRRCALRRRVAVRDVHDGGRWASGRSSCSKPNEREEMLAKMERCLDMMLAARVHSFDTAAWNV